MSRYITSWRGNIPIVLKRVGHSDLDCVFFLNLFFLLLIPPHPVLPPHLICMSPKYFLGFKGKKPSAPSCNSIRPGYHGTNPDLDIINTSR